MSRAIVSLNSGSSSIKFGLFMLEPQGLRRAAAGKIEGIGVAPHLIARRSDGSLVLERRWEQEPRLTHEVLLDELMDWAADHLVEHQILAVGHRVVHGGPDFRHPQFVDEALLAALERLVPLAPLHQPHNLAAIRAIRAHNPDLPQIACFDTAFHADRPDVAERYAVPNEWQQLGIRRYGFHGLAYEYLARALAEAEPTLARGRVLAAHLGNGASLCAIVDRHSIDTTMGFSVLDGLVMGTRCGSLDPGVILHMIQQQGLSAERVQSVLYDQSGLLGVSGISSDMRVLRASSDPRAAEAIELSVLQTVRQAGALIAVMGGIDALIFSGGIGENDAAIRQSVCERLAWLGLTLNDDANQSNDWSIDSVDSRVAVRIIPADEEQMIALHCRTLLGLTP